MSNIYGGYDDFDDYPGCSMTYGKAAWPCFPHSDKLRGALFCTYYKENDLAYAKIGELYNQYCLTAREEPLSPYPMRQRWFGVS